MRACPVSRPPPSRHLGPGVRCVTARRRGQATAAPVPTTGPITARASGARNTISARTACWASPCGTPHIALIARQEFYPDTRCGGCPRRLARRG